MKPESVGGESMGQMLDIGTSIRVYRDLISARWGQ